MNEDAADVSQSTLELDDTDIHVPVTHRDEPLEAHNVTALRWWLLCQGIKAQLLCENIRL